MAHHIAGANHLTHGNRVVTVGCDHIQHTCRNARANGQFSRGQCGQRRQFGRFDDHRATRCQSGRHLARDHGQWKIPGCDGSANTNGLFENHQAAVIVKLGQGFAVDAFRLFGKPFDKAGAVSHFTFGFGKWLALLSGHDAPQVFLVGHEQIKPFAQNDAALLGCFCAPGGPCRIGCRNGGFGICGAHVGDVRQFAAVGRIKNIKAAGASHPLTVDQGVCLEQGGVFEQRKGRCFHVHGSRSLRGLRAGASVHQTNWLD